MGTPTLPRRMQSKKPDKFADVDREPGIRDVMDPQDMEELEALPKEHAKRITDLRRTIADATRDMQSLEAQVQAKAPIRDAAKRRIELLMTLSAIQEQTEDADGGECKLTFVVPGKGQSFTIRYYDVADERASVMDQTIAGAVNDFLNRLTKIAGTDVL